MSDILKQFIKVHGEFLYKLLQKCNRPDTSLATFTAMDHRNRFYISCALRFEIGRASTLHVSYRQRENEQ